MGFFKNIMNKITGGGAKVTIEVLEPKLDAPFTVKVTAVIGDSELKVSKVYLYIKENEHAVVRNVEIPDSSGGTTREDVEGDEEVYRTEVIMSGPEVLEAKKTYEWTKEVSLPASAAPTFEGKYISHSWHFYAGIDAPGNDPDSGWIVVDIC